MPDSGIERTITLPDLSLLKLSGLNNLEDALAIKDHLRQLHESIAAAHDDLAKRINEFIVFQEWGETTHAQFTADQNNYNLGDGVVHRLSSDASRAVTGFLAPVVARFVVCLNVGAQNITFPHQSASSDADNRIITATGATLTLASAQSVAFWYDLVPEASPVRRWRQLTL
jgi:hypothetical protein